MTRDDIDWQAVHDKIEAASSRLESSFEPSRDEVRKILSERAAEQYRKNDDSSAKENLDVLAFSLDQELYAVETRWVREVGRLRNLTPIPGTRSHVVGAVSLRGRILAVVDLRKFFGVPSGNLREHDLLIVLGGSNGEFGLLVDAVLGIRAVEVTDLHKNVSTLTGNREKYLTGVTGEMLAVLDGARLLADTGFRPRVGES